MSQKSTFVPIFQLGGASVSQLYEFNQKEKYSVCENDNLNVSCAFNFQFVKRPIHSYNITKSESTACAANSKSNMLPSLLSTTFLRELGERQGILFTRSVHVCTIAPVIQVQQPFFIIVQRLALDVQRGNVASIMESDWGDYSFYSGALSHSTVVLSHSTVVLCI